jgi:hypothetical protein
MPSERPAHYKTRADAAHTGGACAEPAEVCGAHSTEARSAEATDMAAAKTTDVGSAHCADMTTAEAAAKTAVTAAAASVSGASCGKPEHDDRCCGDENLRHD